MICTNDTHKYPSIVNTVKLKWKTFKSYKACINLIIKFDYGYWYIKTETCTQGGVFIVILILKEKRITWVVTPRT